MSNNQNTPHNQSVDINDLLVKLINSNKPTQKNKPSADDAIDLREVIVKYMKKWHWFAISISICIGLAFLYLQTKNNEYSVESTIMIRTEEGSAMPQMEILKTLGMMGGGGKEVEDELYIINSANLMTQVVKNLDIQTQYTIKKGLRHIEQYPTPSVAINLPEQLADTLRRTISIELHKREEDYKAIVTYGGGREKIRESHLLTNLSAPLKTTFGEFTFTTHCELEEGDQVNIVTQPMIVLVEALRKTVTADLIKKGSNVVKINTRTDAPRKGIDIINELVRLYNLDALIDKNIMATNTAEFIEERLTIVTQELNEVELDVESYMTKNQITNIEAEAQLFLEGASEYQKMVAEIETQLNVINYIQAHVKNPENQFNLIPSNLGVEDVALISLVQEYNKALLDRMKLLRTTNEKNPVIQHLEAQLHIVRDNIISSIASLKEGIIITKKDLENTNKEFNTHISEVPTRAREFIEIKRQQVIKETLYTYLYQKREENALTLASAVYPAKTIDVAKYDPTPVAPISIIILFLAIIMGGCIPIGLLFIKDIINNKIEDEIEYEKIVDAPVTGYICTNPSSKRIVVRDGETSSIVELFRLIRTNLTFLVANKPNPVILITSSISGEGKSFIAANLASSFALLKKRVVIVGLDIRNPSLSEYIGLGDRGHLTTYLSDNSMSVDDLIVRSEIAPNLDIIPAGAVPPNPGELLLRERLDDLIAELRTRYDYILIDSAPIGMVSDTFLLNRFADMTLYVSRANYTPRNLTELINTTYQNNKLNNMVCLLNGVKLKTGAGYGYGYAQKKKA